MSPLPVAPAAEGDKTFAYYSDKRANALRLGVAYIRIGVKETITWEEVRRITLLKNRRTDYPLNVSEVEEFGTLATTVRPLNGGIDRMRGVLAGKLEKSGLK